MKHLMMPEDIRREYKRAASFVYNYIGADLEAFNLSTNAWVECIRDAGRIGGADRMGFELTAAFKIWIKENEYNQAFRRDMNKAVREIL
jgi:hypothetical protein